MAIALNARYLKSLGYGALTREQASILLTDIYKTAEHLVGKRLASEMSEDQLDQFEQFYNSKDDAGAFAWLEKNFPEYKLTVEEVMNQIRDILRKVHDELNPSEKDNLRGHSDVLE